MMAGIKTFTGGQRMLTVCAFSMLACASFTLGGCAKKPVPPPPSMPRWVETNNLSLNMSEAQYRAEVGGLHAAGVAVSRQGIAVRMVLPSLAFFTLDGRQLKPSAEPALMRIVRIVNAAPTARIHVVGYTGDNYTPNNAKRFSRHTASEVKRYLVARGVRASRISVVGAGNRRPIVGSDAFGARSLNQRVEVILNPR